MNGFVHRVRKRVLAIILTLAFAVASVSGQTAPSSEQHKDKNQADDPVYDVGPGITPPRVLHQVTPKPSANTDGFRVSGIVIIGLVVDSTGSPRDVHVVRSLDKDLDRNALDAVIQWRFEPARKNNQPVSVRTTIEIRFRDL
jgi:TonB family protein